MTITLGPLRVTFGEDHLQDAAELAVALIEEQRRSGALRVQLAILRATHLRLVEMAGAELAAEAEGNTG